MATCVVERLEAVDVEVDEREAVAVAVRALDLLLDGRRERLMVQEAGEGIQARPLGEVADHALDVERDAPADQPVDGRLGVGPGVLADEACEHAA
jgi:hypothetical protein